jgi:thermitase
MNLRVACFLLILSSAAPAAMAQSAPEKSVAASLLGPPYAERKGEMEFSGRLIAHTRPRAPVDTHKLLQEKTSVLDAYEVEVVPELDEYVVTIPPGEDENSLGQRLWSSGEFDWVRPDWILYPAAVNPITPNDPLFGQQWHLSQIKAPDAWDINTGAPTAIIAIVDTGVDLTHPDLAANLVSGYDSHFLQRMSQAHGGTVTDSNGHGTMVAGVAAAIGNNAAGVCGVGWNLRIMPIRATNPFTSSGGASFSDLQNGALWASNNGAKVVNISYSGVADPGIETLGATLQNRGVLLVWPMDDAAVDYGTTFDHAHVMVVSGTDQLDGRYPQSSFGLGVDIAAPAASILTTTMGGGYGANSGNSFAGPQVAGAAAMIWGLVPTLLPSEVVRILTDSADDIGNPGPDNFFGAGRLNLHRALWLTIFRGDCAAKPAAGYNADALGIDDLYEFFGSPVDVSGDGVINPSDLECMESFLRANEVKCMILRRP